MALKKGKKVGHSFKPGHIPVNKFPLGNKEGLKLKDADIRQEAYRQYCEHVASGFSQESFHFDHPELSVTYKTMNKYIQENPTEFPPIHMERAKSQSRRLWEGVVHDSAKGKNKDANTASLQMLMRNKFGWDRDTHVTHSIEPEARKIFEEWRKEKE